MKQKRKREQKSFRDQLNDINIELFGKPLQRNIKHKDNDEVKLDKKKSTHTDVIGYGPRRVCAITMATLPIDYMIDPIRLDAPCDVCINEQCPYAMGIYNLKSRYGIGKSINELKRWGFRKGTNEPVILDYKEEK